MVSGVIGASAPAGFSTATAGTSVTDNGNVTWISLGPASNFGTWAAPSARLSPILAANWAAANHSIWVSDNHAETQASALTITFPGAAVTPNLASGIVFDSGNNPAWPPVDFVNCDSAGTSYTHVRSTQAGLLTAQTSVYRSNAHQPYNGVVNIGWLITTTSLCPWIAPFESFNIAAWNTVTGTNRGVTVYGLFNGTAVPNNDQAWIEAQYLGSASSPLFSFANNTKANNLATGTPLTADTTSVWNAPAWQASTVYSVGNVVSGGGNARIHLHDWRHKRRTLPAGLRLQRIERRT